MLGFSSHPEQKSKLLSLGPQPMPLTASVPLALGGGVMDTKHVLPPALALAAPAPSPLSPDTWVARCLASYGSLLKSHLLSEV